MKGFGVVLAASLLIVGACSEAEDQAADSPPPILTPESVSTALDVEVPETWRVPDAKSIVPACRDRADVATCIADILVRRTAGRRLRINLVAGEGAAAEFPVRDNITLFNVADLEIIGVPTWLGTLPILKQAMPANRNYLQYWLVYLIDVRNVRLSNLVLDGKDLQAERGIGVCGLRGAVQNIQIDRLKFRNFIYFNVLLGNSLSGEAAVQIGKYPMPVSGATSPQGRLIQDLRVSPPAGCAGEITKFAFRNNTVYMKSVGFYLVPYSALTSAKIPVQTPLPSGNTALPQWYKDERLHAARVSGVDISDNRFVNDLPNPPQSVLDANGYHSALKLHHASGTIIAGNVIEAANAPTLFASGAAINLAAGMYGTTLERNRINFAAGRTAYPHGIGIDANYFSHAYYGFGDKQIFGPGADLVIRGNYLQGAKVRFMDCCVQETAASPDYRAYCQQRDDLVRTGLLNEGISMTGNVENGIPGRDAALIWRSSVNELPWVRAQHASACRQNLNVRITK